MISRFFIEIFDRNIACSKRKSKSANYSYMPGYNELSLQQHRFYIDQALVNF